MIFQTRVIPVFFVFLLTTLLGASPLARAEAYPWIQIREDDIQVSDNFAVETVLRLELVQKAQSSIDIVTYDQRLDTAVGLPLVAALRAAADRGVKVRMITAWASEFAADHKRLVPGILVNPPAREPIQLMVMGGWGGRRRGWGLDEGVHNKLLIVDNRIVLATGRGQSDHYTHWVDTVFFIKGSLAEQTREAYQQLWQTVSREAELYRVKDGIPPPLWPVARPETAPAVDSEHQNKLEELRDWIAQPAKAIVEGEPSTIRARLLHHDFIRQMRALPGRPRSYGIGARLRVLKDPVIDAFLERLANSKTIEFTTLSMILHPALRDGLLSALKRGTEIKILTNSPEALRKVAPFPAPWTLSLPDLQATVSQGLRVDLFTPGPQGPAIYLHRKVAIFEDAVIFGSHNFNLPSTISNDEISFEVESPRLATHLRDLFGSVSGQYGKPLGLPRIIQDRKYTAFKRWMFRQLIGLF